MSRAPIVLLPPSEGKAPGGSRPPWTFGSTSFTELDAPRRQVMDALADAIAGEATAAGRLLGVKGPALEAAVTANRSLLTSPTRPAIERYTGVLYGALDAGSLATTPTRRLRAQVVVLSGLWGLVRPVDLIPDYKLKMGANLPGLGRLSSWWRPAVTAALAPVVESRVVWDLLPAEHAAAWAPELPGSGAEGAPAAILSARFLDEVAPVDDERRFTTVSHWNKLLKGALVRHVLSTQLTDPSELVAFEHPEGYVYDPSLTEERKGRTLLAFVRPAR